MPELLPCLVHDVPAFRAGLNAELDRRAARLRYDLDAGIHPDVALVATTEILVEEPAWILAGMCAAALERHAVVTAPNPTGGDL